MLEQLKHLKKLQDIDVEIQNIENVKKTITSKYDETSKKAQTKTEEFTAKSNETEKLKKEIAAIEAQLEFEREKVKKSEDRLSEIKTEEEYRAGLKELEAKQLIVGELETSVLKKMMGLEEIQKSLDILKSESDLFNDEAIKLQEEIVKVSTDVNLKIENKRAERNSAVAAVSKPFLSKYNFLNGKLKGRVVVEAKNTVCMGCHMQIQPQLYIKIQKNDELNQCPNCQRIVYYFGLDLD